MCEFQSLYFDDDGYVLRCKDCNHYQVAFISTILTLNEDNFQALCQLVKHNCNEPDYSFPEQNKSVVLQTPSNGICMLLTKLELKRFNKILEEADNESKALSLISLFNTP